MKNAEENDEMVDEIDERFEQLKSSIDTIKSSISADAIPLVLSMNIDVYTKTKKKITKLIKDAKAASITNRQKLKIIKEKEQAIEKKCDEFEKRSRSRRHEESSQK